MPLVVERGANHPNRMAWDEVSRLLPDHLVLGERIGCYGCFYLEVEVFQFGVH